ncbi:DUF2178 domain-containing protein [Methanobacterium aggregans]|uniref:DUF2178 domain-containing protein n=1 Tax=Methanobacterium aggregans TaxID=1615586 RepID=UPI001AE67227|nr:DUF2178 domain-containing protein [Methanobacterium aggregans]MBP2045617.1 putative membrane protein [Methanobacterium aggregans]
MNLKKMGKILITFSLFTTGLWIVGLLMGNIILIGLAILCMVGMAPVLYIHRNDLEEMFKMGNGVREDERTQLINDKAANMTLGVVIAVTMWIAIVLITLRASFPQYMQIGYTLFAVSAFTFVIYVVAYTYYRRKY